MACGAARSNPLCSAAHASALAGPEGSTAGKWAALEAASSSARGSGLAPDGPASRPVSPRRPKPPGPEEPQEPSWGTAEGPLCRAAGPQGAWLEAAPSTPRSTSRSPARPPCPPERAAPREPFRGANNRRSSTSESRAPDVAPAYCVHSNEQEGVNNGRTLKVYDTRDKRKRQEHDQEQT